MFLLSYYSLLVGSAGLLSEPGACPPAEPPRHPDDDDKTPSLAYLASLGTASKRKDHEAPPLSPASEQAPVHDPEARRDRLELVVG